MLEFPIKRTITIDDSKKGRKKKSAQKEKVVIKSAGKRTVEKIGPFAEKCQKSGYRRISRQGQDD